MPCDTDSKTLVTPSIGITIFPENGEFADVLIESADKAMYQAKRAKSIYAFSDKTGSSPN